MNNTTAFALGAGAGTIVTSAVSLAAFYVLLTPPSNYVGSVTHEGKIKNMEPKRKSGL